MNKCGACTACCTVLGIAELKKPAHTACAHQCPKGCSIYEKRPTECRTYRCLWLQGTEPEGLRPDNLGVILDAVETKFGPAIVVREIRQGASLPLSVQNLVERYAKAIQGYVYIQRPDGTRSVVLPPWSAHLAGRMQEQGKPQ